TTLRVPDKPECFDVLSPKLVNHRSGNVLQICVIVSRPDSRRRIWRRDDQAILVFEIHDREVMTLPVSIRSGTIQAQNERDLLASFEIARILEEIGATGLHLDHRALVYDPVGWTVLVRAVKHRRVCTGSACQAHEFLSAGRRCQGCDYTSQREHPD